MTSVLMGNDFPLISGEEGFTELEKAGMIRVDLIPMHRPVCSVPNSPSYQYGVNKHADIILHIPSLQSLQCASFDTAGQCRRKSIGFTRRSIMSNSGACSEADLLAIPLQAALMASTIKRVSSPTDFGDSRASKNPRDMLITRLKSVKLKPEDMILHTNSTDEFMDSNGDDDEVGLDLDSDQASICSTIIPCEKNHLTGTSSSSTEACFGLQDHPNWHQGVLPSAQYESLSGQATPRRRAISHSEGKVSSIRNTIAAARKNAGDSNSGNTGRTILPSLSCSSSSNWPPSGSLSSPSSTLFSHSQSSLLQQHHVTCDHPGISLQSQSLNATSLSPRITPRRLHPSANTTNVFGLNSYNGSGHSTPRLTPLPKL